MFLNSPRLHFHIDRPIDNGLAIANIGQPWTLIDWDRRLPELHLLSSLVTKTKKVTSEQNSTVQALGWFYYILQLILDIILETDNAITETLFEH